MMNGQVARRLFTSTEFQRLAETGILSEDDRVELLDGEIIKMGPIGSRHVGCVIALSKLLMRRLGNTAVISSQNPVVLNRYSEPQPDIAVLRSRKDDYRSQLPGAGDIVAIIEVADTSAEYDRGPKLRTYAHAEISEVWIVDVAQDVIEVYRRPVLRKYRDVETYKRGQRLSLAAFPGKTFRVNEILG